MPRRQFKLARQINKLKAIEAADRLGVSQPTLSAWEGERKSPGLDNLENMADLYGVTTDFLLGRTEQTQTNPTRPVSLQQLPILHGRPVWSPTHGWMLVNAMSQKLICSDGNMIGFSDTDELFTIPPQFADSALPQGQPLSRLELHEQREIWLEPISCDTHLREELRGWYRIKSRWAENEYGNRFYLDTYGAKWLAFDQKL